ncbi:hypothetical protein ACFE33_06680 [Falsihalocynthiibacter sp. SS001]|uniref:hypothetical protein n=1 Tax=Falsihalocynthiibacter sp. SS001 TaxID=3349698 RepID=UPI0036D3CCEE
MPEVLAPIRTANYSMLVGHHMGGMKRMIGGFPEASAFGFFTLGLFGFWLRYLIVRGRSKLAFWALVATALVLLRSTSSAAYVAIVVLVALMGGAALFGGVSGEIPKSGAIITVCALGVVSFFALASFAAYQFLPPVTNFLDNAVFDKIDSQSGVERMSWNAQALTNFVDTYLLGAGLGSIRASNWLIACLGSIGVIGTALYLMFLYSVVRVPVPRGDIDARALISGLKVGRIALFISAMLTIPTPDLGIFFFALAGLIVGLSRGLVMATASTPVFHRNPRQLTSFAQGNGRKTII